MPNPLLDAAILIGGFILMFVVAMWMTRDERR